MIRRHYNPQLAAWYWSDDGLNWYSDECLNPVEFQ